MCVWLCVRDTVCAMVCYCVCMHCVCLTVCALWVWVCVCAMGVWLCVYMCMCYGCGNCVCMRYGCVCVCLCACYACVRTGMYVEIREQLLVVTSLLPPCWGQISFLLLRHKHQDGWSVSFWVILPSNSHLTAGLLWLHTHTSTFGSFFSFIVSQHQAQVIRLAQWSFHHPLGHLTSPRNLIPH